MPVTVPGAVGLVLRKNRRTNIFIAVAVQHFPTAALSAKGGGRNEDDDLIGLSLAMAEAGLDSYLEELASYGAVRGEDFVITDSYAGVLGELPGWLEQSLAPTGNPPDLEARMDPEVRAQWEASRVKQFSLVKSAPRNGAR